MRYLLCTALALAGCRRTETVRTTQADTSGADTVAAVSPAPAQTLTAVSDRLIGTWQGQGFDAGSTKPQRFTLSWERAPDGGLKGTIAFQPGESYGITVLSASDTTIVYQSEPHRSPTLKGEVVTRTRARFVGDSLVGTYLARSTQGGRALRGRFTAIRGAVPAK